MPGVETSGIRQGESSGTGVLILYVYSCMLTYAGRWLDDAIQRIADVERERVETRRSSLRNNGKVRRRHRPCPQC
jgi:hypothetical protein